MKVSSDNVKTAVLLLGISVVGYIAYKAYATGKAAGDAVTTALDDLGTAISNIGQSAKDTVKKITDGVSNAATDLQTNKGGPLIQPGKAVDFPVGQTYQGITELPFRLWDESTKNFIVSVSATRGIGKSRFGGFDYSKWRVFSDGTIISPAGEYFQMDYTSTAMDSATGFAAKEIWYNGKSAWDVSQVVYPSADNSIFNL